MGALALMALSERDEARRQRSQAENLVEFMIGDLREKLEPAGRLDILDAIGGRARAYYEAENSGSLDDRSLGQRARVLHLLGDIQMQRGDLQTALAFFQQAARSTGEILKRRPNDPRAIYDHAQSVAYIGEIAWQNRDYATALSQLQAYQTLARQLASIDPTNLKWQAEVEEADSNLGVVRLSLSRADDAVRDLEDALAVSRRLTAADPGKRSALYDQAQILAWLADAEVARRQLDAALADRAEEVRIYERLIAASPHDNQAAEALAANREAVARIELATGASAAATSTLQAEAADMDRLLRETPDNAGYLADAYKLLRLLAQSLLQQGRLAEAAPVITRAIALCEAQVRPAEARGDSELVWPGDRLGGARIIALKVAAAGAPTALAQRQAAADRTRRGGPAPQPSGRSAAKPCAGCDSRGGRVALG